MKKLSGGGIKSRQHVKVGVKAGAGNADVIDPRGVSQYGYATGSKLAKTGSYTLKNTAVPVFGGVRAQVPSGNAVAASTVCGVGGSRTIYRSGYQSTHGPVVPGNAPGKRSIFDQYPPEVSDKDTLVRGDSAMNHE